MAGGLLFAEESEYFVKTVPIVKVYPHSLGFKVLFLKSDLSFGNIYVPYTWYAKSGGKAELVYGTEPTIPYMSIFWKDGKFSHMRLYLEKNPLGESYGVIDKSVDYTEQFKTEDIPLEF